MVMMLSAHLIFKAETHSKLDETLIETCLCFLLKQSEDHTVTYLMMIIYSPSVVLQQILNFALVTMWSAFLLAMT